MKRFLPSLMLLAFLLSACQAIDTGIRYKDLDVQSKMSDTIFLPPAASRDKTVWVDIKNTSDQNIVLDVVPRLTARGYAIVNDPDAAHYTCQVNILQAGKTDIASSERFFGLGYGGGALAGAGGGALIGAHMGNVGGGALAGGVIGGITETIANALVKKVTYDMIVDVQIAEKQVAPVQQTKRANIKQGTSTTVEQSQSGTSNQLLYRTRILATATKVNLDFPEAKPSLESKISASISGIF